MFATIETRARSPRRSRPCRAYSLIATIAAAAFMAGDVSAQRPVPVAVTIEPATPAQGTLFTVQVIAPAESRVVNVTGEFAGERLHFETVAPGVMRALAALPIDATGTAGLPLAIARIGGDLEYRTVDVPVAAGDYRLEKLTVAPRFGSPPDSATQARIRADQARAAAVSRNSHDTPRLWTGEFVRPREARVTSDFGDGREFNGQVQSRHMGLDLAGPAGEPVVAAGRGIVALVDAFYLAGNVVYIDHGAGLITAYFHLSRQDVAQGDTVEAGQQIGLVGATGRVTGPHLHWVARYGAITVDPRSLLVIPGEGARPEDTSPAPTFERVYPLSADEGVFAYSRISPDGNLLAYASERRGRQRTIVVADLRTKEIVFTEPGIDAYWSPDGSRMIWLSQDGRSNVSIRHHATGRLSRAIAPTSLGDYYSWGVRDGRDLILTIESRYYFLDGDRGVMPAGRVEACDGIGRGERPLLSREGNRITTFVRGTIVVRDLTGCDFIFDTGIRGAKADFAWGGRYIAFHSPKDSGSGYDIRVVDIEARTVRTITNFEGSSYFPSWTRDGRLSFRYDGDDYRGFMMASDVLSAPASPLPAEPQSVPADRAWADIFPESERPAKRLSLVLVWGPWSAHSPDALNDLDRARDYFEDRSADIGVLHAIDPGSFPGDAERLLDREDVRTPRIPLASERLPLTEAHNQNPTTLLFRDGVLVDRRMGALTDIQIREWIAAWE